MTSNWPRGYRVQRNRAQRAISCANVDEPLNENVGIEMLS